ncbi:predicted protein [Sclerotinia sclerotiorum 1980 UF-70]|uniref:Uncharacterized protein n=1 Tax=Sclerotinia sclerotiorum (strain ATCC 18683 / 1980 / Ss-1) TaxID=665079 RepID=A7E6Y2_SCLS1|nr:predicted protein [Sclerotinia sclerotiorum 1980 UF-70]EDN91654.1 predicted protein [Sclerotinia sclerotiorum 1980 UF-70]
MHERELDERDEIDDYELMRRDEEEGLGKISVNQEDGPWIRKWRTVKPWIS